MKPATAFGIPTWTSPVLVAGVIAAGCAGIDPHGVGNGQFLQVVRDGAVILETETSTAGLMNCPNQAYQMINSNAALAGKVRCSAVRTSELLPYSFVAHIRQAESEGFKPSSPFVTKTLTSALCSSMLAAVRRTEKTVILQEKCD